jgi:ubiquinone/menaquinone biosynthesis C-methylase UbiE
MNAYSQRSDLDEIIDNTDLNGDELIKTLDDLVKINRWLGGAKTVISAIESLLAEHDLSRPLEIVDLGCGSGDLPRAIVRWCRKNNVLVSVTAVDLNKSILRYAHARSEDFRRTESQVA